MCQDCRGEGGSQQGGKGKITTHTGGCRNPRRRNPDRSRKEKVTAGPIVRASAWRGYTPAGNAVKRHDAVAGCPSIPPFACAVPCNERLRLSLTHPWTYPHRMVPNRSTTGPACPACALPARDRVANTRKRSIDFTGRVPLDRGRLCDRIILVGI